MNTISRYMLLLILLTSSFSELGSTFMRMHMVSHQICQAQSFENFDYNLPVCLAKEQLIEWVLTSVVIPLNMNTMVKSSLLIDADSSNFNTRREIQLITEPRTLAVCIGHSADLIWEIDVEENKISKLEWYFNNTKICTSSLTQKFTVNALYQGRIEIIGKTHIRLKNISRDDNGIYIFFPLLKWSTSENLYNISLQVLEPPTTDCTCKISYTEYPPKLTYDLTASYCGRPKMTAFWKRKQTFEVLGERNYILINSSFQDNEILCCPEGKAMKCVDDPKQFCKSISIPRAENEKRFKGGNSTLQSDPQTIPVTCKHSTESTNMYWMLLCVLIVSSLQCAILLFLVFIKCKTRKGNKDLEHVAANGGQEYGSGVIEYQTLSSSEPERKLKEQL